MRDNTAKREHESFARKWDRTIRTQGFFQAFTHKSIRGCSLLWSGHGPTCFRSVRPHLLTVRKESCRNGVIPPIQLGNILAIARQRPTATRVAGFSTWKELRWSSTRGLPPALGISYGRRIAILPGQSRTEEFSTLVHEIAHELLHGSERRIMTTATVRETEAEAVAFIVGQAIGLETTFRRRRQHGASELAWTEGTLWCAG